MNKKFICTVCGYIHEGPEPPEKCPICKVPASKFKELVEEDDQSFATVHTLGAARDEGADEEMIKDLKNHFEGECGEVGMY
ncbi:MAG: NADH peroxidase, partial [Prevotella sp.]|nr:NADH peroxidase [Prevotella sp.]